LIIRIIFGDRYWSWRCTLCGILLSLPSLLDPNVSLIVPFSNTLSPILRWHISVVYISYNNGGQD
jgi:hypothetical protein